jgi:hypothetical protein
LRASLLTLLEVLHFYFSPRLHGCCGRIESMEFSRVASKARLTHVVRMGSVFSIAQSVVGNLPFSEVRRTLPSVENGYCYSCDHPEWLCQCLRRGCPPSFTCEQCARPVLRPGRLCGKCSRNAPERAQFAGHSLQEIMADLRKQYPEPEPIPEHDCALNGCTACGHSLPIKPEALKPVQVMSCGWFPGEADIPPHDCNANGCDRANGGHTIKAPRELCTCGKTGAHSGTLMCLIEPGPPRFWTDK